MPKPLRTPATWSLIIGVAILFFIAGVAKLAEGELVINQFADWGYPAWFPTLVGVLEILGGACLLYPPIATISAAALGGLMLGAIATHLKAGVPFDAIVPLVFLALTVAVGCCRRSEACWTRVSDLQEQSNPPSPANA